MYTWNSAGVPKLAQTITFRRFFSLDELEKTPLGVEIVDVTTNCDGREFNFSFFSITFFFFSLFGALLCGWVGEIS